MSYEIFYDRRFLKVHDRYIPIIQSGSNNAFETNWQGRDVPEKSWYVYGGEMADKVLFTREELEESYRGQYFDGDFHRSRNSYHEDFRKWMLNGINAATTVEEAIEYGNDVRFSYASAATLGISVGSTSELVRLLAEHLDKPFNVGYSNRNYVPKRVNRTYKTKDYSKGYYVLKNIDGYYFYGLKRHGYEYVRDEQSAKKFLTEAEAKAYINRYPQRVKSRGFTQLFIFWWDK